MPSRRVSPSTKLGKALGLTKKNAVIAPGSAAVDAFSNQPNPFPIAKNWRNVLKKIRN